MEFRFYLVQLDRWRSESWRLLNLREHLWQLNCFQPFDLFRHFFEFWCKGRIFGPLTNFPQSGHWTDLERFGFETFGGDIMAIISFSGVVSREGISPSSPSSSMAELSINFDFFRGFWGSGTEPRIRIYGGFWIFENSKFRFRRTGLFSLLAIPLSKTERRRPT